MTLSSQRIAQKDSSITRFTPYYFEEDVKEFIQQIIAKFKKMEIVSGDVVAYEIKALAGDKLI